MTDKYARVARMLENSFHRNQSGKASRWNNEQRTNADGAKIHPQVERAPLPRNVSPAPPLPDWREKLAALRIEGTDGMADIEAEEEEMEGTFRPPRDFTVRYVGGERWRTAEAARFYGEQAEIISGGNRVTGFFALLSDEEVRNLAAACVAYLRERGESDYLDDAIQHLQALVSDHGESIPADILKAISDLDWIPDERDD